MNGSFTALLPLSCSFEQPKLEVASCGSHKVHPVPCITGTYSNSESLAEKCFCGYPESVQTLFPQKLEFDETFYLNFSNRIPAWYYQGFNLAVHHIRESPTAGRERKGERESKN